jgi:hypothetical protein
MGDYKISPSMCTVEMRLRGDGPGQCERVGNWVFSGEMNNVSEE